MSDTPQKTVEERVAEREARRRAAAGNRRRWRAKQKTKARATEAAGPAVTAPVEEGGGRGRPRVRQGLVTSEKADKTITVRIDTVRQHRVYKKTVRQSSTLHAHDASNDAHEGDTVRVMECRPMSATKRWRLIEVVERAR